VDARSPSSTVLVKASPFFDDYRKVHPVQTSRVGPSAGSEDCFRNCAGSGDVHSLVCRNDVVDAPVVGVHDEPNTKHL
jgi:hypothetical protein